MTVVVEADTVVLIYIIACHIIPAICTKAYYWWNDDDSNALSIVILIFGLAVVLAVYLQKMFEVIGNCANNAKAKLKAKLYGQPIGWDGE